jgi:hypothetical protein
MAEKIPTDTIRRRYRIIKSNSLIAVDFPVLPNITVYKKNMVL